MSDEFEPASEDEMAAAFGYGVMTLYDCFFEKPEVRSVSITRLIESLQELREDNRRIIERRS